MLVGAGRNVCSKDLVLNSVILGTGQIQDPPIELTCSFS